MKKIIANRIKQLREYRNYSQKYLASMLDIKQNTYSELENGATQIKPDRLERIAKILDVSSEQLINENFKFFSLDDKNSKPTDSNSKEGDNDEVIEQMKNTIKILQDEVRYLRQQNDALISVIEKNKG